MYIIAEVGQAHDGSLGNAIAFINAASEAKVNAIKFQMHIAEEESTEEERFRVNCFPQDLNRYQYWQRTSFTLNEWKLVSEECQKRNIDLIISPFSKKAVEYCQQLCVDGIKIGSGEFFNEQLVTACIESKLKTIVSTGMASWNEVEELICRYPQYNEQLVLLHCVSKYPCPINEVGLNNVEELARRFKVRTGLSDHSGNLDVALVASARKLQYYEAHICWSRQMFGPDTKSSLTVEEFQKLTEFDMNVIKMDEIVDKNRTANELIYMKDIFGKSLVASRDLDEGIELKEDDLAYKKPAGGLKWDERHILLGKKLRKSIRQDDKFDPSIVE